MSKFESRREFLIAAGVIGATVASRLIWPNPVSAAPIEASPVDPGEFLHQSEVEKALGIYYKSAYKNTVQMPDGRLATRASPIYGNMIYGRDAFFTAVGLGDEGLSRNFYRWFEKNQDMRTGQIPTNVPMEAEDKKAFCSDETNLLYIIWSEILQRQGHLINRESVSLAYDYVKSQVGDNCYLTLPEESGAFRYWADNLIIPNKKADVVSYNQGLYVCALESLSRLGVGGVTPEMIQKAKQGYLNQYDQRLNFVTLSKDLPFQDASAVFPETLHRFLYGESILSDEMVMRTVNQRLRTATVKYPDGVTAGIKIISQDDGSFLPRDFFYTDQLASPGDYQNGGYWPMWSLTELALAYKISNDKSIPKLINQLLNNETKNGRSIEFLCLSNDGIGLADENRTNYSWNCLFIPVAAWAGIYQPRRYRIKNQ